MTARWKQITCIVPEGAAKPAIDLLYRKFGIAMCDFHVARGIGKSSAVVRQGLGHQTEKDMLGVIVSAEQADEVFEFLFHETNINRPHGGIIYMSALTHASDYSVPQEAVA